MFLQSKNFENISDHVLHTRLKINEIQWFFSNTVGVSSSQWRKKTQYACCHWSLLWNRGCFNNSCCCNHSVYKVSFLEWICVAIFCCYCCCFIVVGILVSYVFVCFVFYFFSFFLQKTCFLNQEFVIITQFSTHRTVIIFLF